MSSQYKVKGSTIATKFQFVEKKFGQEARKELEGKFKDRDIFPILSASWYPYSLYVEVLEAISKSHYNGNLSRLEEVGSYSADESLKKVYSSFLLTEKFSDFLDRISKLHEMFYSHGRLEVLLHPNGKGCDLWHRDKPTFSQADLYVAKGFYQQAARLHGHAGAHCVFFRKGTDTHFILTWL